MTGLCPEEGMEPLGAGRESIGRTYRPQSPVVGPSQDPDLGPSVAPGT